MHGFVPYRWRKEIDDPAMGRIIGVGELVEDRKMSGVVDVHERGLAPSRAPERHQVGRPALEAICFLSANQSEQRRQAVRVHFLEAQQRARFLGLLAREMQVVIDRRVQQRAQIVYAADARETDDRAVSARAWSSASIAASCAPAE